MECWVGLFSDWEYVWLDVIYLDVFLLLVIEGGWLVCLDGEIVLMVSDCGEWFSMYLVNLGMFVYILVVLLFEEVVVEVLVMFYVIEQEFDVQLIIVSDLKLLGCFMVCWEILELMLLELLVYVYYYYLL